MVKGVNIDKIVSQTQRKVKGYSDEDKQEFDSKDSNDLNWLDNFLASDTSPKKRNQQPEPELRKAKLGMNRRITDQDFRDRFSSEIPSTPESRTEEGFKKALSKIVRSYTRSIKLVTKLGNND